MGRALRTRFGHRGGAELTPPSGFVDGGEEDQTLHPREGGISRPPHRPFHIPMTVGFHRSPVPPHTGAYARPGSRAHNHGQRRS